MHLPNPLAVAVAMALAASVAQAQTAPAAPATDTTEAGTDQTRLDRITVTGSNIRGIDMEEAQPVRVIDAQEIRELGALSVSDLLKEISQTGGGTGNFNTFASGALQADAPAGSAAASLRESFDVFSATPTAITSGWVRRAAVRLASRQAFRSGTG